MIETNIILTTTTFLAGFFLFNKHYLSWREYRSWKNNSIISYTCTINKRGGSGGGGAQPAIYHLPGATPRMDKYLWNRPIDCLLPWTTTLGIHLQYTCRKYSHQPSWPGSQTGETLLFDGAFNPINKTRLHSFCSFTRLSNWCWIANYQHHSWQLQRHCW